jgi:hypothetical protein
MYLGPQAKLGWRGKMEVYYVSRQGLVNTTNQPLIQAPALQYLLRQVGRQYRTCKEVHNAIRRPGPGDLAGQHLAVGGGVGR